jgi:hypothetical protein
MTYWLGCAFDSENQQWQVVAVGSEEHTIDEVKKATMDLRPELWGVEVLMVSIEKPKGILAEYASFTKVEEFETTDVIAFHLEYPVSKALIELYAEKDDLMSLVQIMMRNAPALLLGTLEDYFATVEEPTDDNT